MERFFLIINPNAGKDSTRKAIRKVFDVFKNEQLFFEYAYTEKAGHATELARKASTQKYDVVVAVGGDGTVNEVARGLVGGNSVMGIIPMGSGNGFARELKISGNPAKAAKIIINGQQRIVDLWKINNHVFLCTSGLGFDATVAQAMNHSKGRGKWKYIRLTIRESLAFHPVRVALSVGGQSIQQLILVATFANASQFGNNAFIAPEAKIDDGLLDVVIIPPVSKIFYPLLGTALFLKTIHRFKFVKIFRAQNVTVQEASSNMFHFDGESTSLQLPVQITLCKEKLTVRVS